MTRHPLSVRLAVGLCLLLLGGAQRAGAQPATTLPRPPADKVAVLERYLGVWDVTLRVRQPKPALVTAIETWEWTLDRRFLHGASSARSDGVQETMIAGYDPTSRGFPFWIFSSTGAVFLLAPAVWTPATQTLEWKNAPGENIQYVARCVFAERDRRQCTAVAKDWKGQVLLDQESSAIRRAR